MSLTLAHLLLRLRRAAVSVGADSDAELLRRFIERRDEDAFAALVARHGPMVLNACRRVLGDAHVAEDSFQATFLVLARRAGSVGRPAALAGWLYGVAARVARAARRREDRRPRPQLADLTEPSDRSLDPLAALTARELVSVLEEEVLQLPEVYRLPVVLCCLEGLSQEEAARRLGCSAGAVKGRLERGRERLHRRLVKRGLTLTAALGVAEASKAVAVGSAPPVFAAAVKAGVLFVSRRASGAVGPAGALAEGVLRMMLYKRLGTVAACCLFGMALLAAGVLCAARPATAGSADPNESTASAPQENAPVPARRLWAGLSVNQPVFRQGDTAALQLTFTLVNDGDRVLDPKLASARIVVNGVALPESGRILSNGPRDDRFQALPPGDHLVFGYALGNYFDRPGIYRVSWEGDGFRSADVVFRVLPKQRAGAVEDPKPIKADDNKVVRGYVERIDAEGGVTVLRIKGVGPVAVDEKTEYLAETGFDATTASLALVEHRHVYAATERRGGMRYARSVVIVRFQGEP